MQTISLEAEVGEIIGALVQRGLSTRTRVHVSVHVIEPDVPPMPVVLEAGGAFDWLADEPDLYDGSDVIERST